MEKKGIGSIIKKASASIGKVVKSGKQAIKKVGNNIKNKANNLVKKAKSTIGNSVRGSKTLAKNIVKKAKSTIGNVVKATKNVRNKRKEVKEDVKETEQNILKKLKNQVKEIKENGFFKNIVKGRVITGAKSYYTKNKEEFIQELNKKGKGKYGNVKFNNLLERGLKLCKKGGKLLDNLDKYLDKSLNQTIKGSYAKDETTFLGTIGEIVVGCIPIAGQLADGREVIYDIQNWEWKWSNVEDLALDVIGFIPAIGDGIKAVKKIPFKEIGKSVNNITKKGSSIFKTIKKGINNLVSKFSKKELKETTEKLVSKNMLKEMANSFNKCFEDVLNSGKQLNFAVNGNIDNNIHFTNFNNSASNSGVEINSNNNNNNNNNNNSSSNYILFNKTHKNSQPRPKGKGPNGGRLQSHHGLQQQWAKQNLRSYNYDAELAPTITIETGTGYPHTIISNRQNMRRDNRVSLGHGKWSSSLQEELSYIVEDFRSAGFNDDIIEQVLEQQYKMLDKLNIRYERINIR